MKIKNYDKPTGHRPEGRGQPEKGGKKGREKGEKKRQGVGQEGQHGSLESERIPTLDSIWTVWEETWKEECRSKKDPVPFLAVLWRKLHLLPTEHRGDDLFPICTKGVASSFTKEVTSPMRSLAW